MNHKPVNLRSLISAYHNLNEELMDNLLNYDQRKIDNDEIEGLTKLYDELSKLSSRKYIYEHYYLGYTIPQISKEFDVLRFGSDFIVNLELKSQSVSKDQIKTQLTRNAYYLKFINENILSYTYVNEENKIYFLEGDNILAVSFNHFYKTLLSQNVENYSNIDYIFNPSNYLISPFNSTVEFTKGEYFLTAHQELIKNKIIKVINESKEFNFFSITGNAGTGKTLLTYDIANSMLKETIIIHCGILNSGHVELISEHGWNIIPAKQLRSVDLSKFKVIIIDETQRIYTDQFYFIVRYVKEHNMKCILSYDQVQCLRNQEARNNIEAKIIEYSSSNYKLTKKNKNECWCCSFYPRNF